MNEKQIELIKQSGLSIPKVAALTGIHVKKLYRVIQTGVELKYSEYQKILILNKYIEKIQEECGALE